MKVEVSSNFKKYAKKTVFFIFVFALTYLFLLALAVSLTLGFTFAGIWIFMAKPMFYTAVLCLGLFASGLSILFFLVKFIFASTKIDIGHLTEITQKDEPQLFALIHEVVNEVKTSFPKKVFLSYEVNASVFYNSNFWSMFLPIRKNLQIGVGLINAVTHQELKAILAHEFGHFSQRSMKVGSYVYHVNQIIYNMLYKNESLDRMFEKWGNVTGYATIFIGISVFIIQKIQSILKKLYEYININYMALSREMEFHADEIAANVAGSQALADSLLRLSLANHAMEGVLNFYEQKINVNVRSENIYLEHHYAMNFLAKKNNYLIENDLPQIQIATLKKYNKSKLNLENQWATHPSEEDRVQALLNLNIVKSDIINTPAINLLSNNAAIALHISNKLFSSIQYTENPTVFPIEMFKTSYSEIVNKYTFDSIFNNFYDHNNPSVEGPPLKFENNSVSKFEELFSDQWLDEIYTLIALRNDKATIEAIHTNMLEVKTFDYDGVRYLASESDQILRRIDNEISDIENKIKKNNCLVYHYFFQLAKEQETEVLFEQLYYDFASYQKSFDSKQKLYQELIENTRFIFETTPFAEIEAKFSDLKRREIELKCELKKLLEQPGITKDLNEENLNSLNRYLSNDLMYFNFDQYQDENLEVLFNAITNYNHLLEENHFFKKNEFLQIMLTLQENNLKKTNNL